LSSRATRDIATRLGSSGIAIFPAASCIIVLRVEDTVAVALISAGATGLIGALGNLLTWKAGQRTASAEEARIEAENDRLREQHREAERQHRQSYYHQALLLVTELSTLGGGYSDLSPDIFDDWVNRYWSVSAAVDLFGAEQVSAALADYTDVVQALILDSHRREDETADWFEAWRGAWAAQRAALDAAGTALTDCMRRDVAAHLVAPGR
jgi:hypothetical protein